MAIVFSITPLAPATPPQLSAPALWITTAEGLRTLPSGQCSSAGFACLSGVTSNFSYVAEPSPSGNSTQKSAPSLAQASRFRQRPRGGHGCSVGVGCKVEWMLVDGPGGDSEPVPWHSGQLPSLRPLPAEGQPAGEGTEKFRTILGVGSGTQLLLQTSPSRQYTVPRSVYTNPSKLITLRRSQLSRSDPRPSAQWGALPPGRKVWTPSRQAHAPGQGDHPGWGGLAHTAHSRYSADFDQLIIAKVSCDQPYPNSGSAQTSPSRGVLASEAPGPPAAAGEPGDALPAVWTQETDKTGCLSYPVVALIC